MKGKVNYEIFSKTIHVFGKTATVFKTTTYTDTLYGGQHKQTVLIVIKVTATLTCVVPVVHIHKYIRTLMSG